jgi:hypothetical protein
MLTKIYLTSNMFKLTTCCLYLEDTKSYFMFKALFGYILFIQSKFYTTWV